MMAYINEEFAGRVGTVMSAYVAGTVFGGFLGRFLVGIIAAHWNWRTGFVTLGILDLVGALAVCHWLPLAVHFVPAKHVFKSARDTWGHLRKPAVAGDLRPGIHRPVFAGGRVHLREFLSRATAVQPHSRRVGQHLLCLSAGLRRDPRWPDAFSTVTDSAGPCCCRLACASAVFC